MTIGSPIAVVVRNQDARPEAYEHMKDVFRPSHADYTTEAKYGIRNWQGGGRASARETIGRVAAGAIARKLLASTAGVTPLTVLPFYVLDKNMDDVVSPGEMPEEETGDPKMVRLKRLLGNFATWREGVDEAAFENADIVFINGAGQLFPMSWAEVRAQMRTDEMLREAMDVFLAHDGMKFLSRFVTGHFQA